MRPMRRAAPWQQENVLRVTTTILRATLCLTLEKRDSQNAFTYTKRLDSHLEAEGAEFFVLGALLVEGIDA